MSSNGIRSVVVGAVLELVIDRPERKNAFTNAMYSQLAEELTKAAASDEIAVVLFYGEAGNFSSGNDLKDFLNEPPTGPVAPVFDFLIALATFPKPILCAVDGFAVGIGTTMLLHADIVYASNIARFQLPFVNLGLVPEAGASLLLPRVAGSKAANELLMFGEAFDAETALRYGIINKIIEQGQLLEWSRARAQTLASKPRAALQEAKSLMKKTHEIELLKQIRLEGDAFVQRLSSPETKQAIQAFFARK